MWDEVVVRTGESENEERVPPLHAPNQGPTSQIQSFGDLVPFGVGLAGS